MRKTVYVVLEINQTNICNISNNFQNIKVAGVFTDLQNAKQYCDTNRIGKQFYIKTSVLDKNIRNGVKMLS